MKVEQTIQLSKNTKAGQHYINAYNRAFNYNSGVKFWGVGYFYKTPSAYKLYAERLIKSRIVQDKDDISSYYIISGNCHSFNCGYIHNENDKKYLIIDTPHNTYSIEL